jgi:hypothetical protein
VGVLSTPMSQVEMSDRRPACSCDSLAPVHGTFGTPKAGNHHAPFCTRAAARAGSGEVRQPVAGHPSPPIVAGLSSPQAEHTRTGHLAGPTPRLSPGLISGRPPAISLPSVLFCTTPSASFSCLSTPRRQPRIRPVVVDRRASQGMPGMTDKTYSSC